MENNGEVSHQISKEILPSNQDSWKNLSGKDSRQRIYKSIVGDVIDIYEPKSQSLVDQNGFSLISPDYFKKTLISPILEKNLTEITVPLSKIIALDTTEDIDRQNRDPNRLAWEIDGHTSVDEFRQLIKQNEFDFNNIDGLYGSELPGGYIIATGGRHRLTAMFLENVSEVKLQVNKIKNPKEFNFTEPYSEYKIEKLIEGGDIKGKIEENPDHSKKLVLEESLNNPLQLFDNNVSDELLDVLDQTMAQ